MKPQWILVANASIARVLERDSADDPLRALATWQHPESRLKGSELRDDRPGHERSDRAGGTELTPRSDPRRKEHREFAREVARRLGEALDAGEYGALAIFASSPFLGELKHELGEAVARHTTHYGDVDLTSFGLSELEARIARELASRAA